MQGFVVEKHADTVDETARRSKQILRVEAQAVAFALAWFRASRDNAPVTRNHWVLLAVAFGVALLWFAVSSDPTDRHAQLGPELPSPAAPTEPREAEPSPAAPNNLPPTAKQDEPASATPPAEPAPSANAEPGANPPPKIPAPERSGPVDELKQLFDSEPRASAAGSLESIIEAPFRRPEVPPGLLKSVMCRTTVCKIETRWSRDRAQGFMSAVMHLVSAPGVEQGALGHNLGISPEGEPSPDGSRAIDVYVKRSVAAAQLPLDTSNRP